MLNFVSKTIPSDGLMEQVPNVGAEFVVKVYSALLDAPLQLSTNIQSKNISHRIIIDS